MKWAISCILFQKGVGHLVCAFPGAFRVFQNAFPRKGSGINCCYPLQRDVLASYSMRCVPPQSNIKCPTPFGHALDIMKVQVEEHGAKALKFYNVRYDYGQPFPWRMDDPRLPTRTLSRRSSWA